MGEAFSDIDGLAKLFGQSECEGMFGKRGIGDEEKAMAPKDALGEDDEPPFFDWFRYVREWEKADAHAVDDSAADGSHDIGFKNDALFDTILGDEFVDFMAKPQFTRRENKINGQVPQESCSTEATHLGGVEVVAGATH